MRRTAATPGASWGRPRPGSRRRTERSMAGVETGSWSARSVIDAPELVRSTVGDISAAAAGKACPASRVATSRATASPPPAESPATAIDVALRPWSARSQRQAARTSSTAAGNRCSGASRYSGNSTRIPLARPSRAASSPSLRTDPSSYPPPCRNSSTRPASAPGAVSQCAGTPPAVTSVHQHVVRYRMKAVPGDEGGAALRQRRRDLRRHRPPAGPRGRRSRPASPGSACRHLLRRGLLSDTAWIAPAAAARARRSRVTGGR